MIRPHRNDIEGFAEEICGKSEDYNRLINVIHDAIANFNMEPGYNSLRTILIKIRYAWSQISDDIDNMRIVHKDTRDRLSTAIQCALRAIMHCSEEPEPTYRIEIEKYPGRIERFCSQYVQM